MAKCVYCGEGAGLLRSEHRQGRDRNRAGWEGMVAKASTAATGQLDHEELLSALDEIAQTSYIRPDAIRPALIEGWELAVERALDDHVLSEEEEAALITYQERFALSQEDAVGAYTRIAEAATLRSLLDGEIHPRQTIAGPIPFNLQKSETLVWVFNDVDYYEAKTRREFVGRSAGVSVRVARGVYVRSGGFKGHAVETTTTELADSGLLGITTKHIYFSGTNKKFRAPFAKIVTFEPYADGIGIMWDAATAKPQTFVTGDGWFVYNLVTNLAQM